MKELFTAEACKILRVDRKTLYRLAKDRIVKMKRKRVAGMEMRVFDAADIKKVAGRLPRKRGRGFKIAGFL